MLGDRLCIATNGVTSVRMSEQELVACDYNNYGCNGGWMTNAILYLENYGVYSTWCMSYQQELNAVTQPCTYRCDSVTDVDTKYFCEQGSMKVLTNSADIMQEIMTYGSGLASFGVYEDFYAYSGGIYKHVSGKFSANHATRIVGWGYDTSGKLYWQGYNQWGTLWGENYGTFRIYN